MSNNEIPTYNGKEHKLISFNKACKLCPLSCGEAVGGAGPEDLKQIKLIVISDYPGMYEVENGYPFWDNIEKRTPFVITKGINKGRVSLPGYHNAGGYLREILTNKFNFNTYSDCWLTNALKCPKSYKGTDRNVTAKIRSKCVNNYLKDELAIIDEYRPDVPILIAGKEALAAIRYICKNTYDELTEGKPSLRKLRRIEGKTLFNHPLVFTVNPAQVCDAEFRIEREDGIVYGKKRKKIDGQWKEINEVTVTKIRKLPNLPLSPRWIFEGDIEYLRKHLHNQ